MMMNKRSILAAYHVDNALGLATEARTGKGLRKVAQRRVDAHINTALNLAQTSNLLDDEAIRTVHHFSCTGGTLFAKCIASMANVLLLNEIDLHSTMPRVNSGSSTFTPTDIISLVRQGDRDISSDLVAKLFLGDLEVLREEQWMIGRNIVLRDHSHSHYLTGEIVAETPTLCELVRSRFSIRSIVTVRDPIDSWLSMITLGWNAYFEPPSFEEYCRRYLVFLNDYKDVDLYKYEDLVIDPKKCMKRICTALHLDYFDGFEQAYGSFRFSGDSGRRDNQNIMIHQRRSGGPEIQLEIERAPSYLPLCSVLGYSGVAPSV